MFEEKRNEYIYSKKGLLVLGSSFLVPFLLVFFLFLSIDINIFLNIVSSFLAGLLVSGGTNYILLRKNNFLRIGAINKEKPENTDPVMVGSEIKKGYLVSVFMVISVFGYCLYRQIKW